MDNRNVSASNIGSATDDDRRGQRNATGGQIEQSATLATLMVTQLVMTLLTSLAETMMKETAQPNPTFRIFNGDGTAYLDQSGLIVDVAQVNDAAASSSGMSTPVGIFEVRDDVDTSAAGNTVGHSQPTNNWSLWTHVQ
jgi:hypothetical protein